MNPSCSRRAGVPKEAEQSDTARIAEVVSVRTSDGPSETNLVKANTLTTTSLGIQLETTRETGTPSTATRKVHIVYSLFTSRVVDTALNG